MIYLFSLIDGFGSVIMHFRCKLGMSNKTVRHPLKRQFGIKTNRYEDKSAPHFLSNKREMQSKHN